MNGNDQAPPGNPETLAIAAGMWHAAALTLGDQDLPMQLAVGNLYAPGYVATGHDSVDDSASRSAPVWTGDAADRFAAWFQGYGADYRTLIELFGEMSSCLLALGNALADVHGQIREAQNVADTQTVTYANFSGGSDQASLHLEADQIVSPSVVVAPTLYDQPPVQHIQELFRSSRQEWNVAMATAAAQLQAIIDRANSLQQLKREIDPARTGIVDPFGSHGLKPFPPLPLAEQDVLGLGADLSLQPWYTPAASTSPTQEFGSIATDILSGVDAVIGNPLIALIPGLGEIAVAARVVSTIGGVMTITIQILSSGQPTAPIQLPLQIAGALFDAASGTALDTQAVQQLLRQPGVVAAIAQAMHVSPATAQTLATYLPGATPVPSGPDTAPYPASGNDLQQQPAPGAPQSGFDAGAAYESGAVSADPASLNPVTYLVPPGEGVAPGTPQDLQPPAML